VIQQNKQDPTDRKLSKPERRNVRFEQEVADSRDHDKQSGKDGYPKKPVKGADGPPKKP
jgi:hypothetical protein